jgi:hypothetical protein
MPLTRTGYLEQLLHLLGQMEDVVRGPSPEHQAIPRVSEARLQVRVLDPQEILVENELFVRVGQELFLLLGVPLLAVSGVKGLDLFLLTDHISHPARCPIDSPKN